MPIYDDVTKLVVARMLGGPFGDVQALRRRAGLSTAALDRLARADAFASLALDRRAALWQGLDRVAAGLPCVHVEAVA